MIWSLSKLSHWNSKDIYIYVYIIMYLSYSCCLGKSLGLVHRGDPPVAAGIAHFSAFLGLATRTASIQLIHFQPELKQAALECLPCPSLFNSLGSLVPDQPLVPYQHAQHHALQPLVPYHTLGQSLFNSTRFTLHAGSFLSTAWGALG